MSGGPPPSRRGPATAAATRRLAVAVVAAALLTAPGTAQEVLAPPDAPGCDPHALAREGAVIGRVGLHVADVFDASAPGEDTALFRFANRLHVRTRDRVVRRQLLVAEGDPFSPRLLAESERILRGTPYLYDAKIRIAGCGGGVVDLEVYTRDVWTLTVGLSFAREGGESSFDAELQDSNFLGLGKDIELAHESDVDRTVRLLRYRDVDAFARRVVLELWYADNSDGHRRLVQVERPFFSLDARWSAGVRALDEERVDSLYTLGEISDQFTHSISSAEASWGRSRGLVGGQAVRWTAGAAWEEHRFSAVEGGAGAVPSDRRLVYPWVGVELLEDGFVTLRNVDSISRTEDLNLAARFSARFGLAATGLGSDRNAAVFALRGAAGRDDGSRGLLLAEASVTGRWGREGAENLVASGRVRWWRRTFGPHLLFASAELTAGSNLDQEVQILLGGDSGLRGYPLRYQSGTRRALVTLEQRIYTGWYPFRLAHVGGAVFLDVGRVWSPGASSPSDRGVLKDVGIGLRIASSRSSSGTMIHLDVAFPLDRADGIESVQWLVTTSETF